MPDPLNMGTLDEALWTVWRQWPYMPLPEDLPPRERDFLAFSAGLKATVLAFIGAEGETLADTLIASLMMRDAIVGALDEKDAGRDDAPGDEPGAP
jgi:hypothetical protein